MLTLQPKITAPVLDTQNEKRYTELKEKAGRFRVLIIGGANAGKTTILQKICNTTENPEITTGEGKKINSSTIEPTIVRGHHDIRNEMVFQSSPTFIFHDSCGFEAGGTDEFEKAKSFVAESAKEKILSKQVHVIWYCIAMDDDRPVTYAEMQFFSKSGTGKVPVIVVFTKCEALEIKAITKLQDIGYEFDEAVEKASNLVSKELKDTQEMLEQMDYPPKGYVCLQELEKPENDCQDLVKCTAEVLDSRVLQGLFISTQQNSLDLAMEISLR
ncbi:hypothetical protein BDZ94DRAFT_1202160 [Collybia nuda]|uniref:G domain-containing protein n=1 Tax=Collybia nuda TaxID=64659 RepID=A0A9P6C9Y4_9AGAR|nr:hypothetical protein BDZ94DRAFT_1202160 [Collybia nuda]